MPILKMLKNKSLVITRYGNTYCGENSAETIKIFLPKEINGFDIKDCSVWFNFCLPDKDGNAIELSDIRSYTEDYAVTEIPMHQEITNCKGTVKMWIDILGDDSEFTATTNAVAYNIYGSNTIDGSKPTPDVSPIGSLADRLKAVEKQVESANNRIEDIATGDEQIVQPMFIGKIKTNTEREDETND